jgi:hypothetical protein
MSTNTPTELSAVARAAHDAAGADPHPLHRYLTWSLADLAEEAARLASASAGWVTLGLDEGGGVRRP